MKTLNSDDDASVDGEAGRIDDRTVTWTMVAQQRKTKVTLKDKRLMRLVTNDEEFTRAVHMVIEG